MMIINDGFLRKLDTKRHNRMKVLRLMQERGKVTRSEICDTLNMQRTNATILLTEMLEQGLIEEFGEILMEPNEMRKGRRQFLLGLNPTYRFALGVYISCDTIAIGLTTLSTTTMERQILSIHSETTMAEIVDMIHQTSEAMLKNCCLTYNSLVGIGIGIMPEMRCKLGVLDEKNGNGYDFSNFEAMLQENVGCNLYIADAIPQLAAVCATFDAEMKSPSNISCLYARENTYHLAAVQQHEICLEFCWNTEVGDRICVNAGGRYLEGYCRGSVKAELVPSAIAEKVAEYYGESKTPALYALTNGCRSHITLGQLMTAVAEGDQILTHIQEELVHQFCVLLINVRQMYFSETVMLLEFDLSESNMECIREKLRSYGMPEEQIASYRTCTIPEKALFSGAAQYAIGLGFYLTGGISDDSYTEVELISEKTDGKTPRKKRKTVTYNALKRKRVN